MKKCNTLLMKELKEIREEKVRLYRFEADNFIESYLDEEVRIKSEYDYTETRQKIEELSLRERKIKKVLDYSNATTIVEGYNITINEALVLLAQMLDKKSYLKNLTMYNQLSRTVSRDKVEYHKARYDIKLIKEDLKKLTEEITLLQMAIDRTNLNNMIEI